MTGPAGFSRRPAARAIVLFVLTMAGLFAFAAAAPALAQAFGGGPKTTPFGLGGGAPAPGGIGGYIIAKQAEFYHLLIKSVRAAKADGNAFWALAGLSFAYGVFHAAGPGHGKAVISSYLLADGGTLRRGAGLALAAGVVQALTAVLFVGILAAILGSTAASMAQAMNVVEIAAYGGIALFGLYLAFTKGRALIAALAGRPVAHAHAFGADCDCGDAHMPDPRVLQGQGGLRSAAAAVLSAGLRPCSGAILVLTFALSQGVFLSGVAATFAMGLGTALTVTAIAALAVYGKRIAVRLAASDSRWSGAVMLGIEFLAALLVMLFGLALLTGYLESERLLPGG